MTISLIWAGAALAIAALLAHTALRAWRGWLDLKRYEIAQEQEARRDTPDGGAPAVRIEMADLKERLRRLEAIAQGVDL